MTTTWKFTIDFDAAPEFSATEVRDLIAKMAVEAEGRVVLSGNNVYLSDFDDAFVFRMRVGHVVDGGAQVNISA